MIEVQRVREKIEKNAGFRELVFAPDEISYCDTKANRFEHYAARFAAKEAFLKAMGTGWSGEINFNEIVIRNDSNGKPTIDLQSARQIPWLVSAHIHLSMSHLKELASAIVIIETDNS
jgi:holo-[acyl-carrier protein] synthase